MSERAALLSAIQRDRDEIIDFFRGLVRIKTPNPPGDTREAAAYIGKFLSAQGLDFRTVAPKEEYPSLIASFDASQPGRHLVLNGHIDVFPVDPIGWTQDPWGGDLVDGKIYGRGACDMKAGTSASIFTYRYLHRIRDKLKGKLTLTCVSDEETFGPWGARYLIEHCPEVYGDCLLNGEPSGTNTIRFGEKGPLWMCAVKGGAFQWVQVPPGNAPAGSNRSSHGGDEMAEAFGLAGHELVAARVCRPQRE